MGTEGGTMDREVRALGDQKASRGRGLVPPSPTAAAALSPAAALVYEMNAALKTITSAGLRPFVPRRPGTTHYHYEIDDHARQDHHHCTATSRPNAQRYHAASHDTTRRDAMLRMKMM